MITLERNSSRKKLYFILLQFYFAIEPRTTCMLYHYTPTVKGITLEARSMWSVFAEFWNFLEIWEHTVLQSSQFSFLTSQWMAPATS